VRWFGVLLRVSEQGSVVGCFRGLVAFGRWEVGGRVCLPRAGRVGRTGRLRHMTVVLGASLDLVRGVRVPWAGNGLRGSGRTSVGGLVGVWGMVGSVCVGLFVSLVCPGWGWREFRCVWPAGALAVEGVISGRVNVDVWVGVVALGVMGESG